MNIFKIFIAKDKAQTVTELESWTLKWSIQGSTYMSEIVQHKAFINKKDALEFEKQLKSSADFLGCWVTITIKRN